MYAEPINHFNWPAIGHQSASNDWLKLVLNAGPVTMSIDPLFANLVLLWVCHFPIGILGLVWHLIVLIPDLCTLIYFDVSFLQNYNAQSTC